MIKENLYTYVYEQLAKYPEMTIFQVLRKAGYNKYRVAKILKTHGFTLDFVELYDNFNLEHEPYGKYASSILTGDISYYNELEWRFSKFSKLLFSNMRILNKVHSISGVNNHTINYKKYTLFGYLLRISDIECFFRVQTRKIEFLEYTNQLEFAVKQDTGWFIKSVTPTQFTAIFPKGLPITEKQFKKWVSYIGYKAKKYYQNDVKIRNAKNLHKQVVVDEIKKNIQLLQSLNYDVKPFLTNIVENL